MSDFTTMSIDIIHAQHRASPISSSMTSSTGSDWGLDGDLLPDLWQTTSLSSIMSNSSANTLPAYQNYPVSNASQAVWSTYELSLLPNNLYNEMDEFEDTRKPFVYYNNSPDELFNFEHQAPPLFSKTNRRKVEKVVPVAGPVNTQLYKTERCASFMKMGVCPYGNKCQFAHGENELKIVSRPPKWRLKPCVNWGKFGNCRYGNRCCFKHGEA